MNLIYELNTRLWLKHLCVKHGRNINLGSVPEEEITELRKTGFTAVWLMGVWRASQRGREIALKHKGLRHELLNTLPDIRPEDIACSPYCIAGYEPDAALGGSEGLINFKARLHKQGIKLILDFVPNHLSIDHPWVKDHPEYFISASVQEPPDHPGLFFVSDGGAILAHGKDPYFAPWTDVAQLNYFNPDTRRAVREELLKVSLLCDGVRCDMAMLILNRIQRQTWGERVFGGQKFRLPQDEFWPESIAAVKKERPDFCFIAEVYWGLDAELAGMGFDYVYDKCFYDALREGNTGNIRANLNDDSALSDKRLRFIENHDEGRAMAVFGEEKSKAASLLMLCAPGAHLLHQGQMEGLTKRIPVQLVRAPEDAVLPVVARFYKELLERLKIINRGKWRWRLLEPVCAWEGNGTFRNVFAFAGGSNFLAVINYSQAQAQCYLRPDLRGLYSETVILKDLIGPEEYLRDIRDITEKGLYLDMRGYGVHLFNVRPGR